MRSGTGTVAQWLRLFIAEDLGLVSSTQMVISLLYKIPVPGDKVPSSDFCGHHVAQTNTHKLKNKRKKLDHLKSLSPADLLTVRT